MRNEKILNASIQIISLMLIFLFTYTAVDKLANHKSFEIALLVSPVLSRFAPVLSWIIPIIEAVIVGLLAFPGFRHKGLLASAVLMTLFASYIGYMLLFVPERACSCGRILARMTWAQHLLFNVAFASLAAIGYLSKINKRFIAINRTSRTPA